MRRNNGLGAAFVVSELRASRPLSRSVLSQLTLSSSEQTSATS